MAFINAAERQRIEAAIRAAEARTSGEFVTVVARTSDHYLTLPILYASGLALMTPLVTVGSAVEESGPVSAETVNGNVDARMAALQGDEDMDFKTVNGSVSIYVPASFGGRFRFDTVHGGIDSDFPMTISGKWGPRHASGTIGNGSRDIHASSVNGSIELRRQ